MLAAQSTFFKDWEENVATLKQFDPDTYAKLAEGAEHVKGLNDPLTARDGWKLLSSDLAISKQRLSTLFAAKMQYEAAEKMIGEDLLKKYGKTDWQKAQQSVSLAEKADSINGAIALWKQAEEAVSAEWNAMRTRQSQIKIECNAPEFKVFLINSESKLQTPFASSSLSLTPFVEHDIEIRAKGFTAARITLKLDEPGVDCGIKRVVLEECKVVNLEPNWKGMYKEPGRDPYLVLFRIDVQNGNNISGVIYYPSFETKTKFRGSVENERIVFTEYELIQGKSAVVPVRYEAVINGSVMEGSYTYSNKMKSGVVTGPFRLEQSKDIEHSSDYPPVNNSGWQPAPSTWNSQNKPVAQPNKPSYQPKGRTAW
jgi:hypothetical protein